MCDMKRMFLVGFACTVLAAACASARAAPPQPRPLDPNDASPDAVRVTDHDYKFEATTNRVKAGTIDFVVTNEGKRAHEFSIVPLDGDRYGLPIGEIEPFVPGETHAMRADLRPGRYVFVCLVVSIVDDEPRSHMGLGMRFPLEVTE